MPKDDHLELKGTVVESGRGIFRVLIENDMDVPDHIVLARVSGKMKMHKINIVIGDKVTVKVSPYDLTNGFICRREKS